MVRLLDPGGATWYDMDHGVSIFVSNNPLDIFQETSGQFSDVCVTTKLAKKSSFPNLNRVVLSA